MTILKHIKEDLGETKNERKLKSIFNKIESMQISVIGISSAENDDDKDRKIQDFIRKYEGLDAQIAGEIEQVNELRRTTQRNGTILFALAVIGLICGFAFLIGWSIWLYNNKASSFIPIVSLINSVYIFIAGKLIEWLKKGH
jgi:hypothetical protein